jgi:predicted metalloprotease with PDZ domain
LQVGDVVTEIQGKPASEESEQQLSHMNPGDSISIKIRSRGSERELHWKIASRQEISYQVRDVDQVTPEQRARRAAWLKGEAETLTSGTAGK